DFGATALMWSVSEPEKARLLVASGADVNARTKAGRTPLLLAAMHDGGAPTVRMLAERGAKLDVRDDMKISPLIAATMANDMATIRFLLEKGAPVNDKDMAGLTPLMNASMNGNIKAAEMLLARGADVNAVSAPSIHEGVKN